MEENGTGSTAVDFGTCLVRGISAEIMEKENEGIRWTNVEIKTADLIETRELTWTVSSTAFEETENGDCGCIVLHLIAATKITAAFGEIKVASKNVENYGKVEPIIVKA